MESDSGLLRWLKVPFLYNLLQETAGAKAVRRRLIQKHVRAKVGDKVIDIGCGTAQILQHLPEVEYLGLDTNSNYIAFARRKYGSNGSFVVGDTQSLRDDARFKGADIVMAIAVLHHLDDQDALQCIRFAYDALKMRGRFICLEPCWIPNQSALSRFVMANDRGRNIRTEQQYRQLATRVFINAAVRVDANPARIPYVNVVLECEK
jgi:ubiquinone/menaquinone biosynthesis C-methylase UbiE